MTDKRPITPHKGGRTERIGVRVSPAIREKLERIAEQTGLTHADIIEKLINEYNERK